VDFQKITRNCIECGEPFESFRLLHRSLCYQCGEKYRKLEEEAAAAELKAAQEEKYHRLVMAANMPPEWKDTTFETADPEINPSATRIARQYAERFSRASGSLVFFSKGYGTGKTYLAACIANHVLHKKRLSVTYKKARDLMLEIRRTFNGKAGGESEADILNANLSADLLVLDEVGMDTPTEWLETTYWTVFDRRLEWHLPVVITTNKPLESKDGSSLGERIGYGNVSRLLKMCGGRVIDMTGPDLR
jgi:DNA replication protein DnaC